MFEQFVPQVDAVPKADDVTLDRDIVLSVKSEKRICNFTNGYKIAKKNIFNSVNIIHWNVFTYNFISVQKHLL